MNMKVKMPGLAMSLLAIAVLSGCSEQPKQDAAAAKDKAQTAVGEAVEAAKEVAADVKQSSAEVMADAKKAASETADSAQQAMADSTDELKQAVAEGTEQVKQTASDMAAEATAVADQAVSEAKAAMPSKLDGKALATSKGCVACHSTSDAKMIGPGWGGLAGSERQFTDGTSAVADDDYLRAAITNPNAQIVEGFAPTMPPMPLSDEEVDALVEYIKTLN